MPDSPAAKAGLRQGDLILRFNQEPVGSTGAVTHVRRRISRTAPETVVPIEILRRDRRRTVEVTIGKRRVEPR
jgi:serine protease Do